MDELLSAMGIPPERREEYQADVQGLIEQALDSYFHDLRNGLLAAAEVRESRTVPERPGHPPDQQTAIMPASEDQ